MVERNGFLFVRDFNEDEKLGRKQIRELLDRTPIPLDERPDNLALYQDHMQIGKILLLDHVYRLILNVPGIIAEFGCRWGQNLATFANLRTLYEPTNHLRRIYGFDTFEGFLEAAPEDHNKDYAQPGMLATTPDYEHYLEELLRASELTKPIAQKRKFRLFKGDVKETLPEFLRERPQTIIALAYLDMDLYVPTKAVLEAIAPHLTRGSVVVLDEVNDEAFPGETIALAEVLGLSNVALRRVPYLVQPAYFVVGAESRA